MFFERFTRFWSFPRRLSRIFWGSFANGRATRRFEIPVSICLFSFDFSVFFFFPVPDLLRFVLVAVVCWSVLVGAATTLGSTGISVFSVLDSDIDWNIFFICCEIKTMRYLILMFVNISIHFRISFF